MRNSARFTTRWRGLRRVQLLREDTVRTWTVTLCSLHHGFLLRPWHASVAKALRKEPKWYLRDWSALTEPGKRFEPLCACHLLKAVEGGTDLGFGAFELRYIRDRQGRDVDFAIIAVGCAPYVAAHHDRASAWRNPSGPTPAWPVVSRPSSPYSPGRTR